jgi:competence protein ComEC
VLGATATIVAVVDPLTVLDAGAWLSFGATLGIIAGAARFERWATGSDGASARARHASPLHVIHRIWRALLALLSATVAAELVLLPVSAGLFARVGLLGLVLNFVAIPAMTIVQLAGIVLAACDGWWNGAAHLAARAADFAASWLVDSSMAVDRAPWLVWRVPPSPLPLVAAFYGVLVVALTARRRPRLRFAAGGATVLAAGAIVLAPTVEWAAPTPGRLRVTVLDVGQGDAIAAQFPDGRALLVDAGGLAGSTDFGSRVVTPALWALGIRRLEWIAVTHGDADHVGGVLAVARDLRPREIWEGVPVPPNRELQTLREAAHQMQIAWRQLQSGHRLELGPVTIEVLHPPLPDWERRKIRNDDSMVLRIRFGDVEWLLTGDAGVEFESAFHDDLRTPVRLLKVAHHGSLSSSSARFVDTFAPAAAFISVGRANFFNHPAPAVMTRFEQEGAIVFRTDSDGAIVTETDGAVVDIRTMSGRQWRIRAAR